MSEPLTMAAAKEAQIREVAEGLPDFTNTKLLLAEIDALRAALSRARAPREAEPDPAFLSELYGHAREAGRSEWGIAFRKAADLLSAAPPALSHALEAGDWEPPLTQEQVDALLRQWTKHLNPHAVRDFAAMPTAEIADALESFGAFIPTAGHELLAAAIARLRLPASPAASPETAEAETKALAFDAFWLGWRTRDESGGKSSAHIADAGWIIKRYLDAYKYGSRSPAAPEATKEEQ